MKKITTIMFLFWAIAVNAQSPVLWLQQPAISPDGQWIAFEYKGNLFKVASNGGNATPLTINSAYNGYPVWSHDGRSIAFASNRYGNFDVYLMSAAGGEAKRLTFDSAKDLPYDFSPDNKIVYFGTERHDPVTSVRFPNDNLWMKLYCVPAEGGSNLLVNAAGTEYLHFNKTGSRFLFQDRKGGEDPWRKHHRSAVTRDIWTFDTGSQVYRKLSDFDGEDREPVWGEGNNFYYLSERSGNQNLFRSTVDQPQTVIQLTDFTKDPVRNLSRSDAGQLVFTQGGELYTFVEGNKPLKIKINIPADFNANQVQVSMPKDGATEMAVSPNGKEVAFVVRGEIYVSAADGSITRRITNTPYQEGMIKFSPNGRILIYSAEKNGSWDIYEARIADKNEEYFYAASTIETVPLIATPKNEYQGSFSPDGKNIAYVEERNILKVYRPETKTTTTLLGEGNHYAYGDGDYFFSWSPDSKYILTPSSEGHAGNDNVILIPADGVGPRVNLTQSGFNTRQPQWGMNGKMMYYISNKEGLRSLSQGPSQSDIYATFFDPAQFDRFKLSKNELALHSMLPKDSLDKDKADKPALLKKANSEPNLRDLADRTVKLSQNSAEIADVKLSANGEKLYFLAKYENKLDLWVTTLRLHETKKLTDLGAGSAVLEWSRDGKKLYALADGKIFRIDPDNGLKISLSMNPVMELNADAERAAIFEHTYQRMLKVFFDPGLQGVDFKYYHDLYARFLPYINNNYDFQILLSEFLGELNSSHTGGRYLPSFPDGDETAVLGLLYDVQNTTMGLAVKEVIAGGPFDLADSKMRAGCVIVAIDGVEVSTDQDWANLLNHKKGVYTQIRFYDPVTKKIIQERIRPSGSKEENSLLYNRWVKIMEKLTDSLSKGTVGYVHIKAMDEANFRITLDKVNGRNREKKALIIDSRFNGGGNLHDQLVKLFGEKLNIVARPQSHNYVQDGPPDGSAKPTCVLMSEGNYSDAFNFPYLYQRLGLGKLIGAPVAGTGTGVYWEAEIDKSLYIGFPQLGLSWIGEKSLLENHQIEPDIKVYNEYGAVLSGHDQQLEAAVKEMLRTIK